MVASKLRRINLSLNRKSVGLYSTKMNSYVVILFMLISGDQLEKEEKILRESRRGEDRQPTGRIVGIIRRKWRQYCGILLPSVLMEGTRHLFVPAEKKIPKIRIETRQAATLSAQKIIVAIDSWPRNSRYPLGHFVRALGNIGDKNTENEVTMLFKYFTLFYCSNIHMYLLTIENVSIKECFEKKSFLFSLKFVSIVRY